MDTFETIRQTGLSKKEASVYAALLDYGHLSMVDLHRKTQINRPALYEVLPLLERKGLISRVNNKKRILYAAESPQKLLQQYQERIAVETEELSSLAAQFEQKHNDKPVVKYFDGEHGMAFVFDDIIHTLPIGGEFYRYSSRIGDKSNFFSKTMYAKKRDERKIERLVITSAAKAKEKPAKLERTVRAIPDEFDLFEDNISLIIYGSKIAYIDYGSNSSFIVESEKIARFQQKLFKLLWKYLK